ncbi:MAG: response regulator [Methanothrix sp.]|jgi:CheY-like chemotaxis protein|nr:response regulator [Methanothrix sp.]
MTSFAALAKNPSGGLISPETIALKKSASDKRVLRVLLAEDNHLDQKIASKMLRMLGHDVDTVENGADAVLAAGRVAYDLLIMDVQMPEMDGIQAVRCIRSFFGSAPKVVFTTGSTPSIYRDLCLGAGGNEFICKPLMINELNAAIERAMG